MINLLSESKDHNLFVSIDSDDLRVAVGLTGMVDEPSLIAGHRCIYNLVSINTKHVATDTLCVCV